MTLTRREKHTLIILAIVALIFIAFRSNQNALEVLEYCGLLFFVLPLSFYVALDPERREVDK
jgi:hypothetical protein